MELLLVDSLYNGAHVILDEFKKGQEQGDVKDVTLSIPPPSSQFSLRHELHFSSTASLFLSFSASVSGAVNDPVLPQP